MLDLVRRSEVVERGLVVARGALVAALGELRARALGILRGELRVRGRREGDRRAGQREREEDEGDAGALQGFFSGVVMGMPS